MIRLTRGGTVEPVSRDQILRRDRGQGNAHFRSSADHEQDWQPYPVDPFFVECDGHTHIHTYTYTYDFYSTACKLYTCTYTYCVQGKTLNLSLAT